MNSRTHLPLICTALLVFLCDAAPVNAQQPSWNTTGSFAAGRYFGHTVTLMGNGKVLIVGGPSAAEFYDPATGQWSLTGRLITPRDGQSAIRLASGKVLVAGGYGALTSAEIYNPDTGTWSATGSLSIGRERHGAILLRDGKVLVTGGTVSRSAELYDPVTGVWSAAGTMNFARGGARRHTATLLSDGRVLVTGGFDGSALSTAELYDPATRSWTVTGQLSAARLDHTATLLPSGKVLVAGGSIVNGCTGMQNGTSSAELYDPATGQWTATGSTTTPRAHHTATLLLNGKVLVVGGGIPGCNALNNSELYDPTTGNWSAVGSVNATSLPAEAALLPNGKVLLAGGSGGNNAEIFDSGMAAVTSISAASFAVDGALAPESIASAFGANLATETLAATVLPLPTQMAGISVKVRDHTGTERLAPLFLVSPRQVNYQVPPGTAVGTATLTVTRGDSIVAQGLGEITSVAPGLFAANARGSGVAAAYAVRINADGTQHIEPVARFDASQNSFVSVPIRLGLETDKVFLILFGTGFRLRSSLSAVAVTIGGEISDVSFAGAAPGYPGLDQINLLIPRALWWHGEVDVAITVDGKKANEVSINVF